MPSRRRKDSWYTTHIASPNHDERIEDLLRPLSGGYVEHYFPIQIERLSCDTLMQFNAKAKTFHIAVRGNFPAARDFAEPEYLYERLPTSPQQGRKNHRNHQRTTYWSPRHRVNDHPPERSVGRVVATEPPTVNRQRTTYRSPRYRVNDQPHGRSVERVLATEPRAIRRASRCHGTANDPSNETPPRYPQAVWPLPGLR